MSSRHENERPSRAEFDALRARLEELEDALLVLHAQKAGIGQGALPADHVGRIVAGESPLRVWRTFRVLTLDQLADRAAVSKPYISEVEGGKKPGSVAFFRKVAKALDVSLDDLTDA